MTSSLLCGAGERPLTDDVDFTQGLGIEMLESMLMVLRLNCGSAKLVLERQQCVRYRSPPKND